MHMLQRVRNGESLIQIGIPNGFMRSQAKFVRVAKAASHALQGQDIEKAFFSVSIE